MPIIDLALVLGRLKVYSAIIKFIFYSSLLGARLAGRLHALDTLVH